MEFFRGLLGTIGDPKSTEKAAAAAEHKPVYGRHEKGSNPGLLLF